MAPGNGGRLLSLDLWHTLVYLEPETEERYMREQVDLAERTLSAAPTAPGRPPLDDAQLRAAFEKVYAEAVAASQQGRSVGPAKQMEEAGARTGRRANAQAYLRGLDELVAHTGFLPAPGAFDVVRKLRGEGWTTAVVSNTVGEPGASLRPVLDRLGLTPLVDRFIFSDEEPWTKPSPEIFREALRQTLIPPGRAVHVGDGWVDIEGARRAGLRAGILYTGLHRYGAKYRALFLPEGWSNPPTPYRFERWPELPAILERIL